MSSFAVRVYSCLVKGEDGTFTFNMGSTTIVGVIDGHGGKEAMVCCKESAVKLQDQFLGTTEDLPTMFEKLNSMVRSQINDVSGCCLTVLAIDNFSGNYVCANVGDVEAIQVSDTSFWSITTSHRLQHNASERMRLKSHIRHMSSETDPPRPVGPPRLYPGGLSCSRSIGDADVPYVSCLPDICTGNLPFDGAIVIASDGLWDFASANKVAKRCNKTFNPEYVAKEARESKDDVTVVIITACPIRSRSRLNIFSRNNSQSSISGSNSDDEFHTSTPTILRVPL